MHLVPGIPIKLLLAICFGMFLGVLSANSIPIIIGALIDGLTLTEAEVGVLGTAELLAVGIAALAAAPLAGKVSNSRLALLGCLLAVMAQFLSAAVDSLYLLVGLRVIAGAGLGLAYATAAMTAAATANPDRVLGYGVTAGLLGALFAGWLGDRWGHGRPVILALVLAGLGYMILGGATEGTSYITGVNLYWVTYMFLLPLLIGAGAAMDPGGRAATLAAGAISLTFALGPACGGSIVTWFSYTAIGWFSCALCLLAALSFILVRPVP